MSQLLWRARNARRVLQRRQPLPERLTGVLDELNRSGIVITTFERLFGGKDLFNEAAPEVGALCARHQWTSEHDSNRKNYIDHLLPRRLDPGSVFVRMATHSDVLAVANHYLGMASQTRAIQLWLSRPTAGPAMETQLWHRDGEDLMNVKLYVYFDDVTEDRGPLAFVPGSHPKRDDGRRAPATPEGRSTDDQMAEILATHPAVHATGPRGTVVLADTCGYHKQVKPVVGERLLMMAQYASSSVRYDRAFELTSSLPDGLSREQQLALR